MNGLFKAPAIEVGNGKLLPHWQGQKNKDAVLNVFRLLPTDAPLLELFGGTGKVTLYAPLSRRWWNDLDPALYRVAVAIRDRPGAFQAACRSLDLQAADWVEWRTRPRKDWPPEVMASAACHTLGGRLSGRLHYRRQEGYSWGAYLNRIPEMSRLLQGVRLTCLDWRACLAEAGPEWAVYADPPYEGASCVNYIAGSVAYLELSAALADRVAVLSGNEGATLPAGWRGFRQPDGSKRQARQRMGEQFGRETHWQSPRLAARQIA